MLKKLFWIAVFATSAAVGLSLSIRIGSSQDPASNPGSLQSIAAEALALGETEVYIDNNVGFEGVSDLNGALAKYTVVEATVLNKKSIQIGSNGVGTWYKFSLDSLIRQNPMTQCGLCSQIPDPPSDIAPGAGELSLLHPGGTVLVDGVSIFVGVAEASSSASPISPTFSWARSTCSSSTTTRRGVWRRLT